MKKAISLFLLLIQGVLLAEGPLVFYHIPKSAGSTVSFLLNDRFAQQEICPYYYYYQIEGKSKEELKKYMYFHGHYFFNSNLLELKDATRITFLRDPVERVLSAQKFFLKGYKENCPERIYEDFFLPAGDPIDTASNQACLFLSSLSRHDPNISINQHLESAKRNLSDSFFFIGFTDDLHNSIHTLFDLLGWNRLTVIPHIRSSDFDLLNIDEKTLNGIKKRNWADIELYAYAKDLMKQKMEHYKTQTLFRPKKPPAFSSSFHFKASDSLPGEGWSDRQFDEVTIQTYRKISPIGHAFLTIPLRDGENYQMVLKSIQKGIAPRNVIFHLNQHEIYCKVDRLRENNIRTYRAVIPSYLVEKNQVSQLKISLQYPIETQTTKWDVISPANWFGIVEVDISAI